MAALQLMPENADRLQRLHAVSGIAATIQPSKDCPGISIGRLRRMLNNPPLSESLFAHAEDPFNNPLTESVPFYGGSYLTLPDYDGDAPFVFRRLVEAIFFSKEPFSSTGFPEKARTLCASVLALSNRVAQRAGFGRVAEYPHEPKAPFVFSVSPEKLDALSKGFGLPAEEFVGPMWQEMRELTAPFKDVVVPASERFKALKNAVRFSRAELSEILGQAGGSLEALEPLITELGAADFSSTAPDKNTLFIRPILHTGEEYVVALPRSLLSATCNALIGKAMEGGIRGELATRFRQAVAVSVRLSLEYLGCKSLDVPVCTSEDPLVTEALFSLDGDKVVYVLLCTDDLEGYDPNRVDNERWSGRKLSSRIKKCLAEAEQAILGLSQPPREILHLVVLQGVEPTLTLRGVKLPKTQCPRQLALEASELETICLLEGGDQLALWKYAGEQQRFRKDRAPIFQVSSELDEFHAYRQYGYDYDFFPEGIPEEDRTAVTIPMGGAGALKREVQRRRDFHSPLAPGGNATIEVTSLYDDYTVPIYAPWHGGRPTQHVETLVEGLPVDVWVCGPNEFASPEIRSLCFRFVEMVAYWTWQLAPGLEHHLKELAEYRRQIQIKLELDVQEGWFGDDSRGGVELTDVIKWEATGDGNLLIRLRPEVKSLFSGSDNAGEREFLRELLKGLRTMVEENADCYDVGLDDERVEELLERHAPLGQKKKLLFMSGEHNLPFVEDGLPPYRKVQSADLSQLRDELGAHLATKFGLRKRGVIPDYQREKVLREAVGFLYRKLEVMVSELSSEDLAEALIAYNERLLYENSQKALSIPTRIECFGPEAEIVRSLRQEIPELNNASIASRFLIEYVAARPPAGDCSLSLATYDQLLAFASEIAGWGYISDTIHFGIQDLRLLMTRSGRLEVRDDVYREGHKQFMGLHLAGEVYRSRQTFDIHWRDPKQAERPQYADRLNYATEAEFGVALEYIDEFLLEAVHLATDGSLGSAVVRVMPVEDFKYELGQRIGWSADQINRAFDLLALRARRDFLHPPEPYKGVDVYPWRFNRPLSYLRRPLIVRATGNDGEEVFWGPKQCFKAALYLNDLCIEGRLKAKTTQMKSLISDLNHRRAEEFNDRVAELFESEGNFVVRRRVDKIAGKYIERERGQGLGDVDVLVADPKRRILLAVETKDLTFARIPAELANELKSTFDTSGEARSAAIKHLERIEWLQANLRLVLEWLGLPAKDARRWQVKPLIIVDHELQSPYVVGCEIEVVSYPELQEKGAQ